MDAHLVRRVDRDARVFRQPFDGPESVLSSLVVVVEFDRIVVTDRRHDVAVVDEGAVFDDARCPARIDEARIAPRQVPPDRHRRTGRQRFVQPEAVEAARRVGLDLGAVRNVDAVDRQQPRNLQVDLADRPRVHVLEHRDAAALDASLRRKNVDGRIEVDDVGHRQHLVLLVALFVVGLQRFAVGDRFVVVQHVRVVVDPRADRARDREHDRRHQRNRRRKSRARNRPSPAPVVGHLTIHEQMRNDADQHHEQRPIRADGDQRPDKMPPPVHVGQRRAGYAHLIQHVFETERSASRRSRGTARSESACRGICCGPCSECRRRARRSRYADQP